MQGSTGLIRHLRWPCRSSMFFPREELQPRAEKCSIAVRALISWSESYFTERSIECASRAQIFPAAEAGGFVSSGGTTFKVLTALSCNAILMIVYALDVAVCVRCSWTSAVCAVRGLPPTRQSQLSINA